MKLKITALSATLVLASMLGACSSVNSSTPSAEEPSVNSSFELDSSAEIEGAEEVPTDNTEMEATDLETVEELTTDLESTDMENSLEQGTPEIESSEAPIESQGSEVILPVEDAAQTPTESEAAENPNLEPAQ